MGMHMNDVASTLKKSGRPIDNGGWRTISRGDDEVYKGKVALITGGGTGTGRAVAMGLARQGINIVVNYSRSREEAEQTAAELRALG